MLYTTREWQIDFAYHHGALLLVGLLAVLSLMAYQFISPEFGEPSQELTPDQTIEAHTTAIETDPEDELSYARALLVSQVVCGPACTFGQIYRF